MKFIIFIFIIYTSLFSNEKTTVSLQLQWKNQFQFAGYYMAKEKGFFKENGLDVTIKNYHKGMNTTNEIIKGNSQFAIGRSTLLIDKSQHKDIILLNAIFQTSPLVLFSLKNNGINYLEDFKNKRIMIDEKQTSTISIKAMLQSQKITLNSMKFLPRTYNINDLIDQKVDLMMGYLSDKGYELEQKNIPYNVFDPKDFGFDFYDDILFTSANFAHKNPTIVKAFQKASLKGWEYAFNHIEETIDLILEKYNTQNKTKEAYLYEANILKNRAYYQEHSLGDLDINKIKRIYSSYNLLGLIDNYIPNFKELIFNQNEKYITLSEEEKNYLKKKGQINICIDPNWFPFEKISKDGQHIGISSDYFKFFAEQIDTPFKLIKTSTWTQTLEFAKQRKCDLISLGNSTASRKKYLDFTEPYLKIPFVMITKHDVQFINDLHLIKNKKIGVVKNSALFEILAKKYPNFQLVEVKNNLDGISKVHADEIFAYVGNMLSVTHIMHTHYLEDLKIINKLENQTSNLAIGIRNDDKILLNIFNHLIQNIPQSLHYDIQKKYITIEYNQSIDFKYINELILSIIFIVIIFIILQIKQKQLNNKLEEKVKEKTKELELINQTLESKIKEEVEKNSKKDQLLAQQAKMVAMGEMLENIAHQWRQPLSIISTSATSMILQKELKMSSEEAELNAYETINNTAQHLSKTIDDFRNFFKTSKEMKKCRLELLMENTLNMIQKSYESHGVIIVKRIDDIQINCLDGELTQVLLNLLNNAKDAHDNSSPQEKYIFIDIYKDTVNAIISIKDNAGGIKQEYIDKIFEPYFTTKHQSQGTGIGLFMSREIITRHLHGSIKVQNSSFTYQEEKYVGAEFMISLPLSS